MTDLLLLVCLGLPPVELARDEPLAIAAVTADRTTVPVYDRLTLTIDLKAKYRNPFDSSQIKLDVEAQGSAGVFTVPGFLDRPCERSLVDGREQVVPAGPPVWRARLAFARPGEQRLTVVATEGRKVVRAAPVTVRVTAADAPGYIRRARLDHRYFATDRGETFFPIGANVCWAGRAGTHDFDRWLPRYAEQGANWIRLWLAPEWMTLSLQTVASGYHGIDLDRAWKLDQVLDLCARLGLRAMLCLDSFNILRSEKRQHGSWEKSPYTTANGGPCATPRDYFTDPRMLAAYHDRLRYLVARWGHSPQVFAWEFWNEVDIIDDFDAELVTAWHKRQAAALRTLDPWAHLITTSTARPQGVPRLDALPELEFVQTHHYQARDMARELGADRAGKAAAADRPHFHGEFGISHSGKTTAELDPTGIHLHNGLFASLGQEQAGTPMTWWWDSYVDPLNLYPLFGAFVRFLDGFDPVAEQARPPSVEISYREPARNRAPAPPVRPADGSWQPAPYNQPVTVTVDAAGQLRAPAPLARVLHGLKNHPTLHNPATFELEVPEESSFAVLVEGVSGHGGARLQISVDGELVLDREFADTDPGTATLEQYNGEYRVPLAAGRHTVKVENVGADWLYLAYDIPWLAAEPKLRALGLVGRERALLWLQNREHTWAEASRPGAALTPVTGARLRLKVADVPWRLEWFDTRAGRVTGEETLTPEGGVLTIDLPDIPTDLGLRLRRAEP